MAQFDISKSSKALNGIQWKVAHQLMFNYGDPIASMDATICVSGEGTAYIGMVCNFPLDSIEGLYHDVIIPYLGLAPLGG